MVDSDSLRPLPSPPVQVDPRRTDVEPCADTKRRVVHHELADAANRDADTPDGFMQLIEGPRFAQAPLPARELGPELTKHARRDAPLVRVLAAVGGARESSPADRPREGRHRPIEAQLGWLSSALMSLSRVIRTVVSTIIRTP